jgi:hypothetical protein
LKTAKITAKGQITVPNDVRRALGVSPFARYRGIGNPQIRSGKKAILEWLRAQRGE